MDGGQGQYYRLKTSRPMPVRWMPPEMLRDRIASTNTDVYSFGMVIQEVFSRGRVPLEALGDVDVVKHLADALSRVNEPNIDNAYIVEEPHADCPPGMAAIMRECIRLVPQRRPTFPSLVRQTLPQHWPVLLGVEGRRKTLVTRPPQAVPPTPSLDLCMDADESRL